MSEFIWIESSSGKKYLINISQIRYIRNRDIYFSTNAFPIEVTWEELQRIKKHLHILGEQENEI